MKKIYTILWMLTISVATMAQGWPEKYEGVMLQGFYWDGYADAQWTNLESQADDLSQFFNLIWVPNSAYPGTLTNNMGYHPMYWFDHKSAFGTEAQLKSMIATFKTKNVGIIEDVVINHRVGVTNWCDFPAETYKGTTYKLGMSDICKNDECKDNNYNPTGAYDTGENWAYARDLDHTSSNVQNNVKAYMDKLLNDLGYVGFRYDFVKGFGATYVGQYNKAAQPQFSVGECWDGDKTVVTNWIKGTKQDGVIQSAAFDFPMKYYINDVFANASNWSKLNNAALSNDPDYARYAVTFVDNHDTGRPKSEDGNPLYANVEAANAFILTMPGTPCVWLKHWQTYKTAIKKQILVRKAAGIHNQSTIVTKSASTNGYVLNVAGKNGNVLLILGSATTSTNGYKLAVEGTNYKMYVSNSVDISALDDIKEDTFTAPDCCVVNDGEICAFFEAPTSYTNVKCYTWRGSTLYGGTWPGQACTVVGTNNGKNVWKWTYTGTLTTPPSNIIFNGTGFNQTADLDFKNGGYYNQAGAIQGVVTGIEAIRTTPSVQNGMIYDLQGRKMGTTWDELPKGLYIVNGKKIVK